jgi:hypothetical protein
LLRPCALAAVFAPALAAAAAAADSYLPWRSLRTSTTELL